MIILFIYFLIKVILHINLRIFIIIFTINLFMNFIFYKNCENAKIIYNMII